MLECGVTGRADGDGLIKPVAHVVVRPDVTATPELSAELQSFVQSRLAVYKRPRWIEFVAELPKTATGKTQRFKLRDEERAEGGPCGFALRSLSCERAGRTFRSGDAARSPVNRISGEMSAAGGSLPSRLPLNRSSIPRGLRPLRCG